MKSKQIQLNNKVGLYMRLSKDDERQGESLSIENQENICQGYFHRKFQRTAVLINSSFYFPFMPVSCLT